MARYTTKSACDNTVSEMLSNAFASKEQEQNNANAEMQIELEDSQVSFHS